MKLDEILIESFGAKRDHLVDATTLFSMPEWDSMGHMLFITKLEEAYNVEFTGNEIAEMLTVGDIKKLLEAKGKTI